jgi:hypothetical protein
MRRRMALALHSVFLFSVMTRVVYAADGFSVDQFIGSPLLILAAVLVIDLVAFAYHKIVR